MRCTPDTDHFTVTTRDRNYRETRRFDCADLGTAYTVAMQLRLRRRSWPYDSLPLCTTDVHITHLRGVKGQGRVVSCLTWPGGPTLAEAQAASEAAGWRWIDPTATHKGAYLTEPPPGETAHRPARWRFAD